MKPVLTAVILVAIFTSNDGWTQGHHDASGEATVTIERSSEYSVESKTFEKRVPVKLEYGAGGCKAELRLEYYQKGADAHVKTMLSNEECGASSGDYTIRIRYKDAQGETGQVEYEEAWNRDDDAEHKLGCPQRSWYQSPSRTERRSEPGDSALPHVSWH